jgi:hypothetical protein
MRAVNVKVSLTSTSENVRMGVSREALQTPVESDAVDKSFRSIEGAPGSRELFR